MTRQLCDVDLRIYLNRAVGFAVRECGRCELGTDWKSFIYLCELNEIIANRGIQFGLSRSASIRSRPLKIMYFKLDYAHIYSTLNLALSPSSPFSYWVSESRN